MRNPFTPNIEDLPSVIPLFPLSGAVVLPHGQLPLNIFEPRYLSMVFDALAGSRLVGMVQPLHGEEGDHPDLHRTGCAGRIVSFSETRDGRILLVLSGVSRFDVEYELELYRGYRRAKVSWSRFIHDLDDEEIEIDRDRLLSLAKTYLKGRQIAIKWDSFDGLELPELIDTLASSLPFSSRGKQSLVEAVIMQDRCELLSALCEFAVEPATQGEDRTH
jgi:Lon protease-like protein